MAVLKMYKPKQFRVSPQEFYYIKCPFLECKDNPPIPASRPELLQESLRRHIKETHCQETATAARR